MARVLFSGRLGFFASLPSRWIEPEHNLSTREMKHGHRASCTFSGSGVARPEVMPAILIKMIPNTMPKRACMRQPNQGGVAARFVCDTAVLGVSSNRTPGLGNSVANLAIWVVGFR